MLGIQVLEPALGKRLAKLGMRGAAYPEWMPGAEDVVVETWLGELSRPDRSAQLRLAFENGHAPAGTCQECGAGE
jgi:hypothetical protein